jgi:mercuric ion transport protein
VFSSTRERNEIPVVREITPAEPAANRGGSKGWLASLGAVFAAFGASLCCIGPLLFVTFGVGAGLASTFEPLRPLFTVLTFAGLAIGFYTVYGQRPKAPAADACCAPGHACSVPRSRTREKVILWTATVLALVFWSFTYWSTLLI